MATYLGDAGNNTLNGSSANDTLDGLAGADTMTGGAGNDTYVVDNAGDQTIELSGGGTDLVQSSVSYTLASYVENLALTGLDSISGVGNTLNNVMTGNAGVNALAGQEGNDTLYGMDGDDSLQGDSGLDSLYGGEGDDQVSGGQDADLLDAGNGADYLYGDQGDDRLYAGVTNVVLNADPGLITYQVNALDTLGDRFYGGDGSDTVIAGQGHDYIEGGDGANVVLAGAGNDIITGGISNYVDAGDGNDHVSLGSSAIVKGGAGDDFIEAAGNINNIDGGSGNDWIIASGVLTGGSGNDLFRIDLTPPTLFGPYEITDFSLGGVEDSFDNYRLLQELRLAGFDGTDVPSWLRLIQSGADTLLQVDKFGPGDGSAFQTLAILRNTTATQITGADFTHWITLAGARAAGINQTVSASLLDRTGAYMGKDGDDSLSGLTTGGNLIDGGLGNDVLTGQAYGDQLLGDFGNDVLYGNAGEDVLIGGTGNDSLYGGDGNDGYNSMYYKGSWYSGGLMGEEGNDLLDGGLGEDLLDGGTGNDTLAGGEGNDVLYAGTGRDVLQGDAGWDQLQGSGGEDTLRGGAGNDSLWADGVGNDLDGGSDQDTLTVSGSGSRVDGGSGSDTLSVYGSGHTVLGGDGDDVMRLEGVATGQLDAGLGNDRVTVVNWQGGYSEAISLSLQINLGDGVDRLDLDEGGYWGTGTVTTGTGSDEVELSLRGLESGLEAAVITDFTVGAGGDRLDLTQVLARLSELGFDFSNPFTNGWLRFVQDGAHARLQVDLNGAAGGGNWQTLAVLQNVLAGSVDLGVNLIPSMSGQGVVINADNGDNWIDEDHPYGGLQPGDGNDVIRGNGGDDLLSGAFGGADVLVGGAGSDALFGFSGNDLLYGDTQDGSGIGGTDLLSGGVGNDTLYGGGGDDNGGGLEYKGRVLQRRVVGR